MCMLSSYSFSSEHNCVAVPHCSPCCLSLAEAACADQCLQCGEGSVSPASSLLEQESQQDRCCDGGRADFVTTISVLYTNKVKISSNSSFPNIWNSRKKQDQTNKSGQRLSVCSIWQLIRSLTKLSVLASEIEVLVSSFLDHYLNC